MYIIPIFPTDSKCAVLELLQDQGLETLAYRMNDVKSGTAYPALAFSTYIKVGRDSQSATCN